MARPTVAELQKKITDLEAEVRFQKTRYETDASIAAARDKSMVDTLISVVFALADTLNEKR